MSAKRRHVWPTGLVALIMAAAGLAPSFASARRAPPPVVVEPPAPAPVPATPPAAGVTFGAVDASTVRVFAVQNVTSVQARGPRGMRTVAIPNMGHGTGFAVPGDDSLVLTAAHVVEDTSYVVVRLPGDGAYFAARVAYRDDERDVAVLQIEGEIPPIELQPATHTLRTRQPVFAVGYPLDASRRQAQSSRGIVGGLMDDGRVQLDMSVNPGNSGGPIIDEADRVVGMVVARGDVQQGVQGLAVAVPLATLHDALNQARARLHDGRVPALPTDAARAAHVIDTLSRVGLMRVLREASDVTEGTADAQTIAEIRALNVPGLSPDMQVFVAAFLWDAAQMLMHRAGNHVHPAYMPRGATRTLTEDLMREATTLLRSAVDRDPTVADRSPFAMMVARGRPVVASSSRSSSTARPRPVYRRDAEVPGGTAPSTGGRSQEPRQVWAVVAGLGLGASGFLGGTDTRSTFDDSRPLRPGAALRLFTGVRLSPLRALVFGFDLDLSFAMRPRASEASTPSSDELVSATPNSLGGGLTTMVRVHPAGGPFFLSGVFRVGAQRFEVDLAYPLGTGTERYRVIQPGLDVGVRLKGAELALRGTFGVAAGGRVSSLYTVVMNVGLVLAGGSSRSR